MRNSTISHIKNNLQTKCIQPIATCAHKINEKKTSLTFSHIYESAVGGQNVAN